ncbi:MAG: response regulator transcription factor, partial [Chitinophagaceae bacterium]|nr:response regulator transcription factor [Chitinophagaceae bacterium]
MYNCLIADDNLVERDALEMHLSKINQLRIVATCSSGSEAAQVLLQEKVDIVFSDIDMPDLSGIGLIKSLSNPPVFIFVSSYTEFAAESYSLDVIDYVVKPALFDR